MLDEPAIGEIREQNQDHNDQRIERESSAGASAPWGDHRDFLRDSHHVGLGMLHVSDEARRDVLGVETKKRGIAAEERNQVKLIGNKTVAVGLDHLDVVRGKMSLNHDLLASETFALAGLGHNLAQRNLGLGSGSSGIDIGRFVFGFFISHL